MKFSRMVCIFALAGAALCLTGCEGIEAPSESSYEEPTEATLGTLSPEDISSIAEAVPTHPESAAAEDVTEAVTETLPPGTTLPAADPNTLSPFGKAVYVGRNTDWEERFFYFLDGAGGNCQSQEDGSSTVFTFTMDGSSKAVFRFGDASKTADLFWMDDNTVMLYWEDGMSETLTRVSEDTAGFRFLSNAALESRAMEIFAAKNGYRPAFADVTLGADETVSIRLYDEIDGYSATCEWYTVNRYTGIGTNLNGEQVNLGDANALPVTSAAPTEPTETQPTETTTEPTAPTA